LGIKGLWRKRLPIVAFGLIRFLIKFDVRKDDSAVSTATYNILGISLLFAKILKGCTSMAQKKMFYEKSGVENLVRLFL
jgi:hypothetical protein